MGKKRDEFKDILQPFAELHSDMYSKIRDNLLAKSEEELEKIIDATKEPTVRNCWWCTYHVAPIVRCEAEIILRDRSDIKK